MSQRLIETVLFGSMLSYCMIEKFSQIKSLLKGEYVHLGEIVESYDGLDEEDVVTELDELVEQDILVRFSDNYFVISSFDSEDSRKEAARKLNKLGNRFHSMADTRTEVEVSGEMVEDMSFKTDKGLDELF